MQPLDVQNTILLSHFVKLWIVDRRIPGHFMSFATPRVNNS